MTHWRALIVLGTARFLMVLDTSVTLLSQHLILLGLFFTIPLYLQVVQGFDAFETGLRLLPVSITMLAASLCAARLGRVAGARRVVRPALVTLVTSHLPARPRKPEKTTQAGVAGPAR